MPIPSPEAGEDKEKYISRCMSFLSDEGKYEQEQSLAICYSKWDSKNEDVVKKIGYLLRDEDGATTTSDIATNTGQGKIDVIGGECPDGMVYDKDKKVCVPKTDETISVFGTYIDGTTEIAGSGQTRVVGVKRGVIDVLRVKEPNKTTRFNKLLGAYLVDDEEPVEEEDKKCPEGEHW